LVNWCFENPSFQAKDALKALKFKLENVAYGGGAQVGIHNFDSACSKFMQF